MFAKKKKMLKKIIKTNFPFAPYANRDFDLINETSPTSIKPTPKSNAIFDLFIYFFKKTIDDLCPHFFFKKRNKLPCGASPSPRMKVNSSLCSTILSPYFTE